MKITLHFQLFQFHPHFKNANTFSTGQIVEQSSHFQTSFTFHKSTKYCEMYYSISFYYN